MKAHRMHVVVPEDHRMTIELPETIRSGPVELIVLVPPSSDDEEVSSPGPGHVSLKSLVAGLAQDDRSFQELSNQERAARLSRVMGAGAGLMSTSDELARRKLEEIEIEERKFEL